MQTIDYSDVNTGQCLRAEIDDDGIAHAPDGYRFKSGYTTDDHAEPLLPLRRGYMVQVSDNRGSRQFYRWSDSFGEDIRIVAWRFWRKTGKEVELFRYPVSRVAGVFPWGDLERVQMWGAP